MSVEALQSQLGEGTREITTEAEAYLYLANLAESAAVFGDGERRINTKRYVITICYVRSTSYGSWEEGQAVGVSLTERENEDNYEFYLVGKTKFGISDWRRSFSIFGLKKIYIQAEGDCEPSFPVVELAKFVQRALAGEIKEK